jgi:flagellar hook-associated protein 1 FlgK
MPTSTFLALNIGVSALETAQQTENVISNNIANASTSGYAVENAVIDESQAFPANNESLPVGQMGQGSQVVQIQRQTNAYLDAQDRSNQGYLAMYQAHQTTLTQLQGIINEPSSSGLQNAVDQFFQSWQTLSTDPTNTAARQSVISQAQTVAQTFETVTSQLEQQQQGLAQTIEGQVNELVGYSAQVATLNQQIAMQTQIGQSPNPLLDQRAEFLNKMAKLANITYSTQSNGAVNVFLGNGANAIPLVGGNGTASEYNQDLNPSITGTNVVWTAYNEPPSSPSETTDYLPSSSGYTGQGSVTSPSNSLLYAINSGAIAGNVQGLDDASRTLASVNDFLNNFSSEVNSQQAEGLTLGGTAGPALFEVTNDSAGNVVLQAAPDPSTNTPFTTADIAAGGAADGPEGNSNATAMFQLQSAGQSGSGTWQYVRLAGDSAVTAPYSSSGTFDESLASIVSQIGVEAQSVNNSESTASALAQQSSTLRQSVSGVDMNQQAALMVQFQNSYNAAAKFISVFNSMLQTLIQSV